MYSVYLSPVDGRIHLVSTNDNGQLDQPLVKQEGADYHFRVFSNGSAFYVVSKNKIDKSPIEGFNPSVQNPVINVECKVGEDTYFVNRFHKEGLKEGNLASILTGIKAKSTNKPAFIQ